MSKLKFFKYQTSQISNANIKIALEDYGYPVFAFALGCLRNENEFVCLVGLSTEWINVIVHDRRSNICSDYGYNHVENRWANHFAFDGESEIEHSIQSSLETIKFVIWLQWPHRIIKKIKCYIRLKSSKAEAAKSLKIAQKVFRRRAGFVSDLYIGFDVVVSKNKAKLRVVQNEANLSRYQTNILNQTCACDDFRSFNSLYQLNDLRRFCRHLRNWIVYEDLVLLNKNKLKQNMIKKTKPFAIGFFFDKLSNGSDFSLVAYQNIPDVQYFYMKDGFLENGFFRYLDGDFCLERQWHHEQLELLAIVKKHFNIMA